MKAALVLALLAVLVVTSAMPMNRVFLQQKRIKALNSELNSFKYCHQQFKEMKKCDSIYTIANSVNSRCMKPCPKGLVDCDETTGFVLWNSKLDSDYTCAADKKACADAIAAVKSAAVTGALKATGTVAGLIFSAGASAAIQAAASAASLAVALGKKGKEAYEKGKAKSDAVLKMLNEKKDICAFFMTNVKDIADKESNAGLIKGALPACNAKIDAKAVEGSPILGTLIDVLPDDYTAFFDDLMKQKAEIEKTGKDKKAASGAMQKFSTLAVKAVEALVSYIKETLKALDTTGTLDLADALATPMCDA